LKENEKWMLPDFVEAVERGLKDAKPGSVLEYYKRIDARVAAMD
jgi:hypothetical protein